jgi:hypothetical protein
MLASLFVAKGLIPSIEIFMKAASFITTRHTSILYNFGLATRSDAVLRIVASASFSILFSKTSHVGISWMRPMTWPAVQT